MIIVIVGIPIVITLLWLFSIRPYCQRNKQGYTPGANAGVTFWIDWQNAKEIAKANGDGRMISICNLVLFLQIVMAILFVAAIARN